MLLIVSLVSLLIVVSLLSSILMVDPHIKED